MRRIKGKSFVAKFTLRSFLFVLSIPQTVRKGTRVIHKKKSANRKYPREEKQKELFNPRSLSERKINQSEKCEENIMKLKSKKVFVGGKLKRNVLNSF